MAHCTPDLSKYLQLLNDVMSEQTPSSITPKTLTQTRTQHPQLSNTIEDKRFKLSVYNSKKVHPRLFSDYDTESSLNDMNTNRKVTIRLPMIQRAVRITAEIVGGTSRTRLFLSRSCRGPEGSNLLEDRVICNLSKQYEFMVKIDRKHLGNESSLIRIVITDDSNERTVLYSQQMFAVLNKNVFRTPSRVVGTELMRWFSLNPGFSPMSNTRRHPPSPKKKIVTKCNIKINK